MINVMTKFRLLPVLCLLMATYGTHAAKAQAVSSDAVPESSPAMHIITDDDISAAATMPEQGWDDSQISYGAEDLEELHEQTIEVIFEDRIGGVSSQRMIGTPMTPADMGPSRSVPESKQKWSREQPAR